MEATFFGKLATQLSAKPEGAFLEIYAPSLRCLPAGSMLVMATLPVVDWNDCLLQSLRTIHKTTSAQVYAAMVMIDPFACWQDFVDALKDAGISGVINFPPASIIELSSAGEPHEAGQELELSRMEWFGSSGFRTMFAATCTCETTTVESRLESYLDGILYLPPEALTVPVGSDMELVHISHRQGSSAPKLALAERMVLKRPM
ncbi:hypothetical protein [Bradyrhizobium yuanmingense]|uniref:hypothetical protein n=1 Tax=Bradyrhizobium yuanmingense TaxID=108015 RepID=UPI0023B8CE5D|nr:hypothetical protein [Bradyrhizobium yuanmingense]MDF0492903.1 hypothetical protein [Bradyrhizobium yuanmingense]